MSDQAVVEKASKRTTLILGEVEAPIGLFKVTRDPARARAWQKPPVVADPEDAELGDALAGSTQKASVSRGGGGGGRTRSTESSSSGSAPAEDTPAPEKPRKGIVKADGEFVDLTDQIAAITERTTLDCLEVVSFIRREQVPRERILNAYYVGTGTRKKGKGHSPTQVLALLYRGLKLRGRAAVVRWGIRTKSAVGVMVAHGSGSLVVLELAYAENVLAPNAECLAHQHVELDDKRVEQMADLIDAMAEGRASLDDVRDHRALLEAELVTRAEHGELDTFSADEYETDEQIEDLATFLEKSLTPAAA
jgi:non-homologous end joining protein Ku